MVEEQSDHVLEIRAVKAIRKGDEITTFYTYSHTHFRPTDIALFGCTAEERRITKLSRESEDLIASAACVPAMLRTKRTS